MSDQSPELPRDTKVASATPKPRRKKSAPQAVDPGMSEPRARKSRKASTIDLESEDEMAKRKPLKLRLKTWAWRIIGGGLALLLALTLLFAMINPPRNIYQWQESWRLGAIKQDWVPMAQIAPAMQRAAVAAEDANFCKHWGFDMAEIRRAIDAGSARGASTISQQVVKNVYLWQGRAWSRKALEAILTPMVETLWSKQRILEVYLNIAEFDEGVFGVEAAARHYFGVSAAKLTDLQAARLAAILPDPKNRSASNPSNFVRKRTRAILSGIATIAADGRDKCFL